MPSPPFYRLLYQIGGKLFADIAAYIDQRYVDEHTDGEREQSRRIFAPMPPMGAWAQTAARVAAPIAASLSNALEQLDEGFSQALLRFIDQNGMTDAQCYKKAKNDNEAAPHFIR